MRRLAVLAATVLCLQAEEQYRITTKKPVPAELERILSRVEAKYDRWLGETDYEAIEKDLKSSGLALSGLANRFAEVTVQEFKIVASDRPSAGEPVARLRVLFEIAGVTPKREHLSLAGVWETLWRQQDGRWRLEKLIRQSMRETGSTEPIFRDITENSLRGETAWEEHLSKSTDHWRSLLDEASGIDVYGHNGIAVADYNGDGLEDFYVCQPSGLPNRLFRNNGAGAFTEVSAEAGLNILDDTRMALFADYDNDGDQDLIAITATQPLLFVNDGRGKYQIQADSGLTIGNNKAGSLTSAALADYDRDGFADLYVCSYDLWTPGRRYNSPTPYYDATNGPPNYLFRNRGDGTWQDVTERSGLNRNNDRFSFAAAWGDYDNDGDPDLYVANDFGRNNLYRNQGDGAFTDVAAEAGVEDLGAGMSVAWADYDNDGDLDLYTGNMWSSAGQRLTQTKQFASQVAEPVLRSSFQKHARGNSLFRNNGDGKFSDVTEQMGVAMGRWAWSSDFFDYDNDGLQDIYIQNGYITGEDTKDL